MFGNLFKKEEGYLTNTPINLYNTETGKLELFEPITKGIVTMYTCGPTVYDYAHIGNFRAFVFADILKRTLVFNGYDVRHTINLTDFGHLTDDGDAGDDNLAQSVHTVYYLTL